MDNKSSKDARKELLEALRRRYRKAPKGEKRGFWTSLLRWLDAIESTQFVC